MSTRLQTTSWQVPQVSPVQPLTACSVSMCATESQCWTWTSWVKWTARPAGRLEEKTMSFQRHMSLERSWNSLGGMRGPEICVAVASWFCHLNNVLIFVLTGLEVDCGWTSNGRSLGIVVISTMASISSLSLLWSSSTWAASPMPSPLADC